MLEELVASRYLSTPFKHPKKRRMVEHDISKVEISSDTFSLATSMKKKVRISSPPVVHEAITYELNNEVNHGSTSQLMKCKFPPCQQTIHSDTTSAYCEKCKTDQRSYIQANSIRKAKILKSIGYEDMITQSVAIDNKELRRKTVNKISTNTTIFKHDRGDYLCAGCSKPGDVVCCVTCPRSYHLHCAGLLKVLKGFQCSICDPKKQDVQWNTEIMDMRRRLPVNRRFDIFTEDHIHSEYVNCTDDEEEDDFDHNHESFHIGQKVYSCYWSDKANPKLGYYPCYITKIHDNGARYDVRYSHDKRCGVRVPPSYIQRCL